MEHPGAQILLYFVVVVIEAVTTSHPWDGNVADPPLQPFIIGRGREQNRIRVWDGKLWKTGNGGEQMREESPQTVASDGKHSKREQPGAIGGWIQPKQGSRE